MSNTPKDYPTNDALDGYDYFKDEHPQYTWEHWASEVAAKLTRMGYWQWVKCSLSEL